MTHSWESNVDIPAIADRLRESNRTAILTHAKPDGDAIGSTLALARALARLGKHAGLIYLGPFPERFTPLVCDTPVIHEHPGCWDEPALQDVDCVAILDTGSWNQLAGARPWLEPRADHAIIIDHHAHGDPEIADHRLIHTSAAAAAELSAEICCDLLAVAPNDLPVSIAQPLYLGLATDTGFFRHSSVTPNTMRLAADLIDAGVDHNALYRLVSQNDDISRLKLVTRALNNMQLFANNTVAVITISKQDIAETAVAADDTGGLADLPLSVASVQAVAVITEAEPALSKVSFRSKAGDNHIDVNALARTFSGGGHVHAAGARIPLPLAEARDLVVAALESAAG
jgi:phosphoesterase RecJ-like protein